jgi:hypothetical protein
MVKGFSWYIYKLNTSNTTTMSELDEIEMERQEAGGIVQQFICSAPKKNHEGMYSIGD